MSEVRSAGLAGPAYLRIVALAAAIGIPAALGAALFLAIFHALEHWLWNTLPSTLGYQSPPWFLVLGLPVVGALIAAAARMYLPGDGGNPPLEGLTSKPALPSYVPGVVLAAVASLSFGAVLGPELPVIALGTAVGVAVNRFARLGTREAAVVANAGAFSAIAALFGGPLVAGMLLVESGVAAGAALIPALLPGLVAAGIGYLIFVGFGSFQGLDAPGLQVPSLPPYHGVHPGDLALAIIVGVLAVFVLNAVRQLAVRIERLEPTLHKPGLLAAGGLAVGGLALLATAFGASSQDVLFSGQTSIGPLVGQTSTSIVLVLLVAKAIAYAVSLGCGYRGGPIFPALFVGIALASVAVAGAGASPTLAVSIGTAAGMAAQTRLLFSPLLLAELLVGPAGADTLPPAVLATTAAWLTSAVISARGPHAETAGTGSGGAGSAGAGSGPASERPGMEAGA